MFRFTISTVHDPQALQDRTKYAPTIPTTSSNDMCNRSQHCNLAKHRLRSSLMMVYVNRNMLEQLCDDTRGYVMQY